MHAIASLLDPGHCARIEKIWDSLIGQCDQPGVAQTPIPHFSWVIGKRFDFQVLDALLGSFTRRLLPFQIDTSGLGIFGGSAPVIYIPIVKTARLLGLHEEIWAQCAAAVDGISPFYAPERWVPHITLAQDMIDADQLSCIMRLLSSEKLQWSLPCDNLALLRQEAGQVAELDRIYRLES